MSAYYNENDPEKAAWLRELIRQNVVASGEVDERSIAEVGASDLRGFDQCHFFAGIGVWSYSLRLAGWPDNRPVWTGSCPCPSFSAAGKGGGFDDPRHLWPAWYRLVPECCPPTIFGEQADDAIGYGWIDLVQTDLERANYAVGKAVLTAAGLGAPHARERLYFVAHAEGSEVLARPSEVLSRSGTDGAYRPGDGSTDVRMEHADSKRCGEAGRGQWISTKERMPEYNRFVPVVIDGIVQHQMAANCKDYWAWADVSADYAPIESVSLWFDMPAPPDSGDAKEVERG